MNRTTLNMMIPKMDIFTIPYFCIIISVFIYMICQCRYSPDKNGIRRELYMKV